MNTAPMTEQRIKHLEENLRDLTNEFIRLDARVASLSDTIDIKVASLSDTINIKVTTLSDKIDIKATTLSDKIDTRFTILSKKIDGLYILHRLSTAFPDRQVAKSASPRTLTDYGAKLSQQIDAPSLAAHYIPGLREKMDETGPMNAWQIQELCFNHAEHEIMKDLQEHDIDRYNQITMCAYREGIDLSQIMRVVGLVMRDQLLQQTGQTPPRAQPDPTFPGSDYSTIGMSHP